jgi:hypothetical protein
MRNFKNSLKQGAIALFSGGHKILGVAGLLVFSASLSHATISACATTTTGSVITTYGTVNTNNNGCSSVDLNFDTLSNTMGTDNVMRVWATGGTITAGPTPNTITTTTLHTNGCTVTTGCDAGSETSWYDTNGFSTVTGNEQFRVVANNGSSNQDAGYRWAFSALNVIAPTFLNYGSSDVVTAVVSFCFDANTSATANTGGCAASGQNGQYTITWSANGADSTTVSALSGLATGNVTADGSGVGTQGVTFTIPTSIRLTANTIFVSTVLTVNGANSSDLALLDFGYGIDQYGQAPEPSTFGLMGSALLGLGFLARRRRKP